MLRVFVFLFAAIFVTPVLADEVWNTEWGQVVYEEEIGDVAIWSYPTDKGRRGWVYFPGLAGNYDHRSVHAGYWIEDGAGSCMVELIGVDGRRSNNWGRVILVFDGPAFPTSWTALGGDCFDEPDASLRGEVPN